AHPEAELVFTPELGGERAKLLHIAGDPLRGIAPEEMDVGVLGGDFGCLAGPAAEIEFRIRLLIDRCRQLGALERIVFAVMGDRLAIRGPELLEDLDLFVHYLIALILAELDPLGDDLAFALAGYEIDRDPA